MKKTLFIRVLAVVFLAALAMSAFGACGEKQPEQPYGPTAPDRFYGSGNIGVTLRGDLSFEANLYHGVRYSGSYAESTLSGVTTVTFTVNGKDAAGTIVNDVLTIPHSWEDAHGHGSAFPLQK